MSALVPGASFGHWRIVAVQGRRATAQCHCGAIRQLPIASIADGSAPSSCGCAPRTRAEEDGLRREASEHRQRCEQRRLWKGEP